MKKIIVLCGALLLLFSLISCLPKPDLVIKSSEAEYNTVNYEVKIIVQNIGDAAMTKTSSVYINADSSIDHPGLPAGTRYQVEKVIPILAAGNEVTIGNISFKTSRLHAKEVNSFEIILDPKNEIDEKEEGNNNKSWAWP